MEVIITKHLMPTNHKGARIKVSQGDKNKIYSFPNDGSSIYDNHKEAHRKFLKDFPNNTSYMDYVIGELNDGYVFVYLFG